MSHKQQKITKKLVEKSCGTLLLSISSFSLVKNVQLSHTYIDLPLSITRAKQTSRGLYSIYIKNRQVRVSSFFIISIIMKNLDPGTTQGGAVNINNHYTPHLNSQIRCQQHNHMPSTVQSNRRLTTNFNQNNTSNVLFLLSQCGGEPGTFES